MAADISLDLLERVTIASPCTANWDDMRGDDKVRHCGQCQLNVYNLSAMTRSEAEALVAGSSGRLCARLYRRADGTVITRDCPVGLAAARRRLARLGARVAAGLGFLLGGGFLFGAMRGHTEARLRSIEPFATLRQWLSPAPAVTVPPRMLMGDVCVAPPSPKA